MVNDFFKGAELFDMLHPVSLFYSYMDILTHI